MTDYADLEAAMADEHEHDERTARARARVAEFHALPLAEQHRQIRRSPDAEEMREARKLLRRIAARKDRT